MSLYWILRIPFVPLSNPQDSFGFPLSLCWILRIPLDPFCLSICSPGLSRIPSVPSSSFHWSLWFLHMFLQFLLMIPKPLPKFLLLPCCFVCSVLEIIRSIGRSNGIILEAQGVFWNHHIKQCHVYYVSLVSRTSLLCNHHCL